MDVHMNGMVAAALMAVAFCTVVTGASAQDRLPPIPEDQLTDAQKKAAAEFRTERKQEVFGPFVPLTRSPQLMLNASRMGLYLRFDNSLPRVLSEFAILLQSRRWTQPYEWYVHAADARAAGLSEAIIKAIVEGRRPESMSEEMEIVYEFSRELNDVRNVSDKTYERMVARFGENGMMDLVGLNGYYSFIAMVLNVGRTPLPPDIPRELTPLPR